MSGLILRRRNYGRLHPMKSKHSVKEKAWRTMQMHIQSRTDPGRRLRYKIERMHKDQGSENLGAAQAGLAEDNIVQTESDRDRHTATNTIEGYFNRVQAVTACLSSGAWEPNEYYDDQTMTTRSLLADDLLQFKPSTPAQRESGTSPIQEQFHMQCSIEAPNYTYGDLLLAHIKKDERPNKTGPRAYTAFYAGECRRVKGNIIAHPITPNADRTGWLILGAQSVNQFKVFPGRAVMKQGPDSKDQPATSLLEEIMDYDDIMDMYDQKPEEIDPEEPHDTAEDFEIEAVVDHQEIDEDDYDYLVKWEDWEDDHNTWHSQDNLSGCEKLIKEYWQHVTKPAAAALMQNLVMSATSIPHTIPQVALEQPAIIHGCHG